MADKVVTIGGQPTYELLDEDNMVSNSDKAIPTQQSVKAYVDSFHWNWGNYGQRCGNQ